MVIPNSVKSIGCYAFTSYSGLTSVTFPNSVSSIGERAFYGCSSLKDIHSDIDNPANVLLGSQVFYNVPKQTCVLHVPVGTVEAYRIANQWKDFYCIVDTQVSSIVLDVESISVYVNGQYQLQPTIRPDNATMKGLSWSSSDNNVAAVDNNGVVTGLTLGTATITAMTTDGTNLSASCEVTVLPEFELRAPAICHLRGVEQNFNFPVTLFNRRPISAVQFVISLPDGVSLVTDSYGDYDVWMDEDRKARNHSVSVAYQGSYQGNDSYLVVISSPTNRTFSGDDGPIVHFNLTAKYHSFIGDYQITYNNIVAAEANETEHNLPDMSSIVRLSYLVGDANADVEVDVADYVVTANYILGRLGDKLFFSDAANAAYNDNIINVTDLVAITNIGLELRRKEIVPPLSGSGAPRRLPAARQGDDIACGVNVDGRSGELTTVSLSIDNDMALSALQLDMTLPDHIAVVDAVVTGRTTRHAVAFNRLDSGVTRLLLSAFGTDEVEPGEGVVLTLTLRGAVRQGDQLTVSDILLVERDLTTHGAGDITVGLDRLSDIHGVTVDHIDIYGRDGNIVIDSPVTGTAQLVWLNGITRELKVEVGRNTYPVPVREGAVYIVHFGDVTKKLRF